MESDRHDDGIFWTPNETFEEEETAEGIVDWFPIADSFPETLWCIHHPDRGTYICCPVPDNHKSYGLVTFSTLPRTQRFLDNMIRKDPSKKGFIPALRTFLEARELVKEREGVQAVMLLDDAKETHLHYVKASYE